MERSIARRRYETFDDGSHSARAAEVELPVSSNNLFRVWEDDGEHQADFPEKNPYSLEEDYSDGSITAPAVKTWRFGREKAEADSYAAKALASSGQVAIDMIEGPKGHGFGQFDYRTKKKNKRACISAGTCCMFLILGPIIGAIVASVAFPKETGATAAAAFRDAEGLYQDISGIWSGNTSSPAGDAEVDLTADHGINQTDGTGSEALTFDSTTSGPSASSFLNLTNSSSEFSPVNATGRDLDRNSTVGEGGDDDDDDDDGGNDDYGEADQHSKGDEEGWREDAPNPGMAVPTATPSATPTPKPSTIPKTVPIPNSMSTSSTPTQTPMTTPTPTTSPQPPTSPTPTPTPTTETTPKFSTASSQSTPTPTPTSTPTLKLSPPPPTAPAPTAPPTPPSTDLSPTGDAAADSSGPSEEVPAATDEGADNSQRSEGIEVEAASAGTGGDKQHVATPNSAPESSFSMDDATPMPEENAEPTAPGSEASLAGSSDSPGVKDPALAPSPPLAPHDEKAHGCGSSACSPMPVDNEDNEEFSASTADETLVEKHDFVSRDHEPLEDSSDSSENLKEFRDQPAVDDSSASTYVAGMVNEEEERQGKYKNDAEDGKDNTNENDESATAVDDDDTDDETRVSSNPKHNEATEGDSSANEHPVSTKSAHTPRLEDDSSDGERKKHAHSEAEDQDDLDKVTDDD